MAAPVLPASQTNGTPTNKGPFKIMVIAGDHVGPEVMKEAVRVLDIISARRGITFDFDHEIAGGCSIDQRGRPITEEVLKKAETVDAVLFGSVGGPEW